MSKYFKEENLQKFKLSEYLEKDESEFKGCLFTEEPRIARTKYIMEILGDISLDKPTYELFIKQFQCFGGRYDVRTKPDTIKGIYEIQEKYPFLTADALDEIWFIYIKDLFDTYSLVDVLQKYIDIHGQTDDALESFIDYVNRKADEFNIQFEEAAKELESLKKIYGEDLIKHLQYIIKSQHIDVEQIKKSLPSNDLIEKDKEQLNEISRSTRIFMGVCHPISYQMIESLATGEGVDSYPDTLHYIINSSRKIEATFTKKEFLESVKKANDIGIKKLKKIQGSDHHGS